VITLKKENKKKVKKEKQPIVKTRTRLDNSIEVELKNPSNTLIGKIFVWLIVIGMTVLSLASLIILIIQVSK